MLPGERFKEESARTISILSNANSKKLVDLISHQQLKLQLFSYLSLDKAAIAQIISSIAACIILTIQSDLDSQKAQ